MLHPVSARKSPAATGGKVLMPHSPPPKIKREKKRPWSYSLLFTPKNQNEEHMPEFVDHCGRKICMLKHALHVTNKMVQELCAADGVDEQRAHNAAVGFDGVSHFLQDPKNLKCLNDENPHYLSMVDFEQIIDWGEILGAEWGDQDFKWRAFKVPKQET
jgi:hypothetical protein